MSQWVTGCDPWPTWPIQKWWPIWPMTHWPISISDKPVNAFDPEKCVCRIIGLWIRQGTAATPLTTGCVTSIWSVIFSLPIMPLSTLPMRHDSLWDFGAIQIIYLFTYLLTYLFKRMYDSFWSDLVKMKFHSNGRSIVRIATRNLTNCEIYYTFIPYFSVHILCKLNEHAKLT